MKTSNKILVGTGLLFITVIFILMIIGRIMIGGYSERGDDYDNFESPVTTNYDLRDFKEVEINDNWRVTIRQGDQFAVEVIAPQSVLENIRVEVVDDRLVFENKKHVYRKDELEAVVTMPDIKVVASEDVAVVELEDFTCDELKIKIEGACKIRGYGNKISNLRLESEGASRVDLVDSSVKNAKIDVTGAGFIELNMDGGDLTGTASGAAKVVYYGTVSTEKIKTAGVVSVRHRD